MIQREASIFLIVGVTTVAFDFVTYRLLGSTTGFNAELCKGVGFLAGTVFSYFANRFWTFGRVSPARGSPARFALLYAATLCTNIAINGTMLSLLSDDMFRVELSFALATAVSATLNFLGMKFFVFSAIHSLEKR